MSYDISLIDPVTKEILVADAPHQMRGDEKGKYGYGSKLYYIHFNMKRRCNGVKTPYYKNYGGRGIKYCDEWEKYENFKKWALESGYEEGLSLDRIDVNGNYYPENCRWISKKEQANNKRQSIMITYNGKTQSLQRWAEESGMRYSTFRARIRSYGWDIEKALNTPVRKSGNYRPIKDGESLYPPSRQERGIV